MSIKYQLQCFECDVFVRENHDAYHLSIQAHSNPLGSGNKLAEYDSEERAKEAAEHFCQMYKITREAGYHLHGGDFKKNDHPALPVAELLEMRLAADELRRLLEQETRLHGTPATS